MNIAVEQCSCPHIKSFSLAHQPEYNHQTCLPHNPLYQHINPSELNSPTINMRFFSVFALTGLAATAIASPVAVSESAVQKRQTGPSAALTLLTNLLSTVKVHTAAINTTVATITSSSTPAEKAAAAAAAGADLTTITTEITTAATAAKALTVTKRSDLVARQASTTTIAAALQALLEELVATVQNLVTNLGLGPLLSFLNPLLSALGTLVLSLIPVVDDLLAIVEELLDGILTGLGTALLGLTL